MKEIEELAVLLKNERPQEWESFPDIELYKDQLLGYMQRQRIWSKGDDALTGAMISNYIKMGLMPGPADKKYTREHIAYLTAIHQRSRYGAAAAQPQGKRYAALL